MNDGHAEYLHRLLQVAEEDCSVNNGGTEHYVHGLRKLKCLALDLRFPEDERNSARMDEAEFAAYSVGLCSVRLDMYSYCGRPVVNHDDPGFKLEHVECRSHGNDHRQLYGEIQDYDVAHPQ